MRLAVFLALAASLTAASLAQRTWIVDSDGDGDFATVAPALAAAADGDTVLVLPGAEAGGALVIDGKGIAVVSPDRERVSLPEITIRNVPSGSVTLLRRMRFDAPGYTTDAVTVEDCDGRVRIEKCSLFGYAGARVRSCTDVTIVASTLYGYDPERLLAVPATAGLHVDDSLVVVDESVVTALGGTDSQSGGLFCIQEAGDGTTAIAAFDGSIVWVSGGTVRAGPPGFVENNCDIPAFAPSIHSASGSRVVHRDASLSGFVDEDGGTAVALGGTRRSLSITDHVRGDGTVTVRASGEPGEVVFALVAQSLGTRYLGDETGTYQMPNVIPGGRIFLGVLDGAGRLEEELLAPSLPADQIAPMFMQGAFVDGGGVVRLTPAQSATVFGDDVPVHVAGEVVRVDPSATPGGNGASWGSAVAELRPAVRRAFPSAGRPIAYWLREGFHRESTSSANESAFPLTPGTRLLGGFDGTESNEGQRDPSARTSWIDGDRLGDDLPNLQNRSDNGLCLVDAAGTAARPIEISGVGFRGAALNGGFGTVVDLVDTARIEDCTFIENEASLVLSLDVSDPGFAPSLATLPIGRIDRCSFERNHGRVLYADARGGARIDIAGCLLAGNVSPWSLMTTRSYWNSIVRVTCCTIAQNRVARGAIDTFATGVSELSYDNTIVWNNVISGEVDYDSQFIHFGFTGPESIRRSLVTDYVGDPGQTGTTGDDPLFVDELGPDGVPGTLDEDLRLSAGSPGVDSGDNAAVPTWLTRDLDGQPRIADDPLTADTGLGSAPFVDRGAYER